MKALKANQLRQMSIGELQQKLDELRTELYRLRAQQSVAQLKDTSSLKMIRRNIARVQTVLNEKRMHSHT
ncbi:MAG: 50S ribosomal protein L29 [Armatimonadota bacterium]